MTATQAISDACRTIELHGSGRFRRTLVSASTRVRTAVVAIAAVLVSALIRHLLFRVAELQHGHADDDD